MHISNQQKETILQAIRKDGFMISGYCRRRGIETDLFYRVINNQRGQTEAPSPKSDRVLEVLLEDNYLPTPNTREDSHENHNLSTLPEKK